MKKLACMTFDVEMDYGGRSGQLETFDQSQAFEDLSQFFRDKSVPVSAFVQTGILKHHAQAAPLLKELAQDFHSHSHTHAKENFMSRDELTESLDQIQNIFEVENPGYRAPFGRLYEGDIELIHELGYRFDASIFPSYRPGVFNHWNAATEPGRWPCGLLEIPFGVIPKFRFILGVSYMKLLGYSAYRFLMKVGGLPEILIFYGHLHDFIPTSGLKRLPKSLQMAFGRNQKRVLDITSQFIQDTKEMDYEWITMGELASRLEREKLDKYRLK